MLDMTNIHNIAFMSTVILAAGGINYSLASSVAFVPQHGYAMRLNLFPGRKKALPHCRFHKKDSKSSSRQRRRATLDAVTELSYKTTTEKDYVSGYSENGDVERGGDIEEMQAVLNGLEIQRRDIKTKIADLESSERMIEKKQHRVQKSLARLREEALVASTKTANAKPEAEASTDVHPAVGLKQLKGASEIVGDSDSTEIEPMENVTLTGKSIGDGKFLLAGKPKQTTSGRSFLWTAYRGNEHGSPTGAALAVKISSDIKAMEHEHKNYKLLAEQKRHKMFVDQVDFFPVYGDTIKIRGESIPINMKIALVMERGDEDLQSYLMQTRHGMNAESLKEAGISALQCLEDLHAAGLVWTDLKTQNFVVFKKRDTEDITIKGIDLESAVPVKEHPIDYCPEACPPEMARACMLGHETDFTLDFSYDIWSFGMFLYELSTGRGFFDGKPRGYIVRMLGGALPGYKPSLDTIADKNLANLIAQCLQDDPDRRPSVAQILEHPYFLG